MDLPKALFAARWLVRDTLRQARSSGLLWAAAVVTLVATALCLSVAVRGDAPPKPLELWEIPAMLPASEAAKLPPNEREQADVDIPTGEMSVLFGAIKVPLKRSRVEAVRMVEVLLAAGVADTVGVLLALLWTAGFLPAFLDPAAASVLLAKPVPRWALFAGKVGGVLVFVAASAAAYLAATGVALGVATRVWDARYYAALPVLLVHFVAFFSVSALLAVWTRSAVVAGLGTVLVWLVCWAVNFAHSTAPGGVTDVAYWLLPKPADLGALLFQALQAGGTSAERCATGPEVVVLTSLALPLVGLIASARSFHRADY